MNDIVAFAFIVVGVLGLLWLACRDDDKGDGNG